MLLKHYCRLKRCFKCEQQVTSFLAGRKQYYSQLVSNQASERISSDDNDQLTSERVSSKFYQHNFQSFESMIEYEKKDAKCQILIEDKTNKLELISKETMEKILDTGIINMYKYRISSRRYCLIKLTDYPSFATRNFSNFPLQCFPVYSRIFTLQSNSIQDYQNELIETPDVIEDLTKSRKYWQEFMKNSDSMNSNKCLDSLVSCVLLNEFEVKLRFFIVNQLEELLCKGPFNQFQILPFGSSVNGFGWNQSDLDLFLTPNSSKSHNENPYGLISHASKHMEGDRLDTQRILNLLDSLMRDFVPGVEKVVPILMARVPIIKFASVLSGLDGDLTFFLNSRDSGIDIAHVLYEYAKLDNRVVKLMVFVKLWAMQQGITRSAPGLWINSFGLMMLVVHFLQIRPQPLLPPISHLKILYDPYKPSKEGTQNEITYDQSTPAINLLTEFFHHLATFDFDNYGCNVMDGLVVKKPCNSSLYIENPTHRHLNVCKNVSPAELTKLILVASQSYNYLARNSHVTLLLKPFTKKKIDVTDLYNTNNHKMS